MTVHSKFKMLPYTCYEMGHTWHHSCTKCSFDMFISSGIASLKIYGVVYLLTALVSRKKLTQRNAVKIFKNYLQSVLFLSFNGSFFVGSFCVLRYILGHINFLTASWLPGFIASYLALFVERSSRHSLLALYVTNIASECFWNVLKARGYVKTIPKGEVLLFAASMTLFGYYFKSPSELNSFIYSAFKFILGTDESGSRKIKKDTDSHPLEKTSGAVSRGLPKTRWRHKDCPHRDSCFKNLLKVACLGWLKGYLMQVGFQSLTSPTRILRNPWILLKYLFSNTTFKSAAFLAWFASVFKGTCCAARWLTNEDKPLHGAFAGAFAALGMAFSPSPSLALYAFWKALETVYIKGYNNGYLPAIPQGVPLLYAFSTAYLFHIAVVENANMKQSYWRFLNTLTSKKISEFNKTLLDCYGLDSGRNQVWPLYDKSRLSESFLKKFYH